MSLRFCNSFVSYHFLRIIFVVCLPCPKFEYGNRCTVPLVCGGSGGKRNSGSLPPSVKSPKLPLNDRLTRVRRATGLGLLTLLTANPYPYFRYPYVRYPYLERLRNYAAATFGGFELLF